ncbi:MAG: hypothetical protein GX628_07625 [Clostridiales bacterium]|nr:hypothetical protein [Clostridiales bacterium]
MLEVLPIQSKGIQKEICTACGLEYDADALAYSVRDTDTGTLIGAAQFLLADDAGILTGLSNAAGVDDADALFMAGRAVLNFLDLHGFKAAYCLPRACVCASDPHLSLRIGFIPQDDGRGKAELKGFFTEPCKHHPMYPDKSISDKIKE